MAVHLRLTCAVPEARFGYPEVRRGLVAAMVMPHLLRHVGERLARYLLLTGELISAEEAYRNGFVNRVVAADRLIGIYDTIGASAAQQDGVVDGLPAKPAVPEAAMVR